jgi:NADH-quinone oxidoreductase subunit M
MLSVVQKVFFGPLNNPKNASLKDLTSREVIALAPLVALVFVIGWFPSTFLDRMTPSVEATLGQYVQARKASQDMPEDAQQALLLPRRSGPLDQGYPEPPSERQPGRLTVSHRADAEKGARP